jgi:asparagine synthase (glutamine-hydrolysing)
MRLRADVPVGAYLSGGLDSSTIAAIIQRLGLSRLDTFSISFNDSQFDESCFQQRMAEFLGTQHHIVHATHSEIGRAFPDTIWHTETAIMRTSPVPMFLLSNLVRSHGYKVVLTGEESRRILAGYDIFKESMIRRFWARAPKSRFRPLLLRRLYPDIRMLDGTPDSFVQAFFGRGLDRARDACFSHTIRWGNNRRTHRFFSEDVQSALRGQVTADDEPRLPSEAMEWHPLARAQYLRSAYSFWILLSSQGDRPAMAHSVEGRFPFLDVRLVEFCNGCRRAGSSTVSTRSLPAELRATGCRVRSGQRKRPYRAPIHRSFSAIQTWNTSRRCSHPSRFRMPECSRSRR